MSAIEPTRIKLCGFTRAADVALACDLRVDFLGLIFARKSARCLSLAQAETLRAAMTPQTAAVALFMGNPHAEVAAVVARIAPHFLQFHAMRTMISATVLACRISRPLPWRAWRRWICKRFVPAFPRRLHWVLGN